MPKRYAARDNMARYSLGVIKPGETHPDINQPRVRHSVRYYAARKVGVGRSLAWETHCWGYGECLIISSVGNTLDCAGQYTRVCPQWRILRMIPNIIGTEIVILSWQLWHTPGA